MQTFNVIIDAWPSRQDLAEDLGVEATKIAVWYFRDSIPTGHWLRLVQAAQRRRIEGVSFEVLATLAAQYAPRKRRPVAAPEERAA